MTWNQQFSRRLVERAFIQTSVRSSSARDILKVSVAGPRRLLPVEVRLSIPSACLRFAARRPQVVGVPSRAAEKGNVIALLVPTMVRLSPSRGKSMISMVALLQASPPWT